MSKKIRTYPVIGEVAYVKSRRAKRLTLSVKPWRGVRITMPLHLAYREAELFLLQNMDWLKEKVKQARSYEDHNDCPLAPSERKAAELLLRQRALEYLPGRTAELAKLHGFSYRRISIRGSRTRWGSCSAVNNINLSIHLMQLPYHLIDYVILHELVHTIHKNHSPVFWQLLNQHTGNAKALAREVRKYRITQRSDI